MKSYNELKNAKQSMDMDIPIDMVSIGVKEAALKLAEITGETVTDEIIDGIYNWTNPIKEHSQELNEILGIEISKNLAECTYCLLLTNIPEGTRDQFKKYRTEYGFYEAKKNSLLNKKYQEFLKKYNIKKHDTFEFSFKYPSNSIHQYYHLYDRYFVELKSDISNDKKKYFDEDKELISIKESEYLELKMKYLKENEE
jgi:tRNA U34 5-carboxymethylaminomethyl modifying GTPase MnmE/TrmE